MRRTTYSTALILTTLLILFLFCPIAQANSLEVSGTVAPERTITLNARQTIIKVTSNCLYEVIPVVYEASKPGILVAYSPKVQSQYLKLSKGIDFSKFGVVYLLPPVKKPPLKTSAWARQHERVTTTFQRWFSNVR